MKIPLHSNLGLCQCLTDLCSASCMSLLVQIRVRVEFWTHIQVKALIQNCVRVWAHLRVRFILMFGFILTPKRFAFVPGLYLCWIHFFALLSVHVTLMLCTVLYWCRIRPKVGFRVCVGLMSTSDCVEIPICVRFKFTLISDSS